MMIRCLRLPPTRLKQSLRHGTCEYNRLSSLLRLQHSQFFLTILEYAKIWTVLQSQYSLLAIGDATEMPYWWRKICPESFCETSLAIHRLSDRLCLAGIADTWHLTPTTPVEICHLRHKIPTIKTPVSMSSDVYLPLVWHAQGFENVRGNSQFRSASLVTSSKWLDLGKISQFLPTFSSLRK